MLEYLEGETLDERLDRPPELSIEEALAIAIQIGDGARSRASRRDRASRPEAGQRDARARGRKRGPGDVKLMDFGLASRTAAPAVEGPTPR